MADMADPSLVQLERLVQFLEDNPGIAKGNLRSSQGRRERKLKWQDLAADLNSLGGAIKDARSWAKVWKDKKYALKEYVSKRNAIARRTGVDIDYIFPLSELEKKIISILGGYQFAVGNQELSVPLRVPIESEDIHQSTQEVFVVLESPATSVNCQVETQPQELAPHPSTSRRSPRRPRLHRRVQPRQSHLDMERERLIQIEEKRVRAELANAAGWDKAANALNNLANAISMAGDKIAEALRNRQ